MAKRRNPKLKSVAALVELEEPKANSEAQVEGATGVVVEDLAPSEAAVELPAKVAEATPVESVGAPPEAARATPAIATEETLADLLPTETDQAVLIEAQSGGAAVSELPAVAKPVSVEFAAGEASTETIAAPALMDIAEVEPAPEAAASVVAENANSPGAAESVAQSVQHDAYVPAEIPPPHAMASVVQAAWNREFLGRAASVGLAAALGVVIGSLTTSALLPGTEAVKAASVQPDVPRATVASVDRLAAEVATLKSALAANAAMAPVGNAAGNADGLSRDIAVLKASFGESEIGANARLLELVAQVNRAEKTEADLGARLARIEKPEPTKADVSPEITGSVKPASLPVAEGWVLWRVYAGRAVVQGRRGVFDVVPGADLPDLGLVREITQRDGRWVVITQNGMIVPAAGRPLG